MNSVDPLKTAAWGLEGRALTRARSNTASHFLPREMVPTTHEFSTHRKSGLVCGQRSSSLSAVPPPARGFLLLATPISALGSLGNPRLVPLGRHKAGGRRQGEGRRGGWCSRPRLRPCSAGRQVKWGEQTLLALTGVWELHIFVNQSTIRESS